MRLKDLEKRYNSFANDPSHDEIGGRQYKHATQLDDDKSIGYDPEDYDATMRDVSSSVFFGELYEAYMSGHFSYFTYLENLFVDKNRKPLSKKEICVPKYVNVIVKKVQWLKWMYAEVVGSRLGNLMNVPVVFNIAPCESNAGGGYRVISVDCIPQGYEIISLEDMGIEKCGNFAQIVNYIDAIKRHLPQIAKEYKLKITPERMQKFIEDFCLQFLFRSCLCGDNDCDVNNYFILFNRQTGDFMLSPMMDLEGFFTHMINDNIEQKYKSLSTIKYVNEHSSELLKNFMIRANQLCASKKLRQCMFKSLNIKNQEHMKFCYELIKTNTQIMSELYHSVIDRNMENM